MVAVADPASSGRKGIFFASAFMKSVYLSYGGLYLTPIYLAFYNVS